MHLRSLFKLIFLFTIALCLTVTVFGQIHPKTKQRKMRVANEIPLLTESALRNRKTRGASESARERRTGARTFNRHDEKGDDQEKGPVISKLKKAGTYDGDLRSLPAETPIKRERPEREGPELNPQTAPVTKGSEQELTPQIPPFNPLVAPAPTPSITACY